MEGIIPHIEVARQEYRLARQHYQQIIRGWPELPRETRSERLRAAADRRQAAFQRYMKSLLTS